MDGLKRCPKFAFDKLPKSKVTMYRPDLSTCTDCVFDFVKFADRSHAHQPGRNNGIAFPYWTAMKLACE